MWGFPKNTGALLVGVPLRGFLSIWGTTGFLRRLCMSAAEMTHDEGLTYFHLSFGRCDSLSPKP